MVVYHFLSWAYIHWLSEVVLLGVGEESQNSPPCPLCSTRHSGSNCMSLGSSAGCTGSGLLRCCCGHTDSPRAGGRGCHCGASPGGSDGALYCSGHLSWRGGGASLLADLHRTWSAGWKEQWDTWLLPPDTSIGQRGAQDSQSSRLSRLTPRVDPSRAQT